MLARRANAAIRSKPDEGIKNDLIEGDGQDENNNEQRIGEQRGEEKDEERRGDSDDDGEAELGTTTHQLHPRHGLNAM